jgi:hypothetical protein
VISGFKKGGSVTTSLQSMMERSTKRRVMPHGL